MRLRSLFLLALPLLLACNKQPEPPAPTLSKPASSPTPAALPAAAKPGSAAAAPGDAEFAAAIKLFHQRRYEESLPEFDKALALDPKRSEFWLWRGRAAGRTAEYASLLQQPGWAKQAIKGFETAAECDGANFEARRDALDFCMQAPGFMGGGKEKAYAQARAMEALSPADGHRAWGWIAMRERDYAKAEAEMSAAVAANPKDAEIYLDFGMVYQFAKRYGDSIAKFREALKVDPTLVEARYRIGETAAMGGLALEEGERELRDYLAGEIAGNNPSPAEARMHLGKILASRGDTAAAKTELAKAVELNPALKAAQKALDGLE